MLLLAALSIRAGMQTNVLEMTWPCCNLNLWILTKWTDRFSLFISLKLKIS